MQVKSLALYPRQSLEPMLPGLEYVHERPMNVVIVSEDLEEFAHIHPALHAGDSYAVTATVQGAGLYRVYVEFTPPGGGQQTASFPLTVNGKSRPLRSLAADSVLVRNIDGVRIRFSKPDALTAGKDEGLRFEVVDPKSGQPLNDVEPYLGAWAHILAIDQKQTHLLHMHPLDDATASPVRDLRAHTHAPVSGPSPDTIRVTAKFSTAGLHKLGFSSNATERSLRRRSYFGSTIMRRRLTQHPSRYLQTQSG